MSTSQPLHTKDFGIIPIPGRLQYDPHSSFHFGILLNICFAATSTFAVANLYYCQPILIELAQEFDVSYNRISKLPTLVQAGYAAGILLITPLGDLVRRRPLLFILIAISASLSIGLAITKNIATFEALSCLVDASSVTPQVLIPLAADLAPPERRATAMSIVFSGLLLGILIARVLSGVIAQFSSWRVVYYLAIGIQWLSLAVLYFVVPDYPAKNKHLTYGHILWTMAKFSVTEPILIQASLVNLASAAAFSSFWVTLTFLLGGDPYNYSTLVIGLFGLIGMVGVAMAPLVGHFIDSLVPWYASLVGVLGLLVFQIVQVIGNGLSVVAVILATFGIDVFRQMLETSLAIRIFTIAPEARSRLNAVYILTLFVGQVMGSAVGTKVFLSYGWRASAGVTLGFSGWQLAVLLLRGPHCRRHTWFGYEGGFSATKSTVEEKKGDVDASIDPELPATEDAKQSHVGSGDLETRAEGGQVEGDDPLEDEKSS